MGNKGGRHIVWTTSELRKVAEAYLDVYVKAPGAGLTELVMMAQNYALPAARWHPKSWIYPERNKSLFLAEVAEVKRLRANKSTPTPPVAKPPGGPTVTSQPCERLPLGTVSGTQTGGDLGAVLEALFERLGEAFGRGLSRTAGPANVNVGISTDPVFLSDAALARANAAERDALNDSVGAPKRPKVLVLGGANPDHADLRREVGETVDLRVVSASRRKVKHALAAWNGSPIVAWTRYCSHGLVQSAKYHSPQNVHYVAGTLADVVAKVRELTGTTHE